MSEGLEAWGSAEGDRHRAIHHRRSALFRSKLDVRLPEKGNSNAHGVRSVHLIITMIADSDH